MTRSAIPARCPSNAAPAVYPAAMDARAKRGRGAGGTGGGTPPWRHPFLAGVVLALAAGCFIAGVRLPVVTLKQFFIFSTDHSILSMIAALYQDGELLLCAILLVFSVLLPAAKIMLLAAMLAMPRAGPVPPVLRRILDAVNKWAMLDVLVVALVIVGVRTSGVAAALSRPGLYFFCAAVVLIMIATVLTLKPRERG